MAMKLENLETGEVKDPAVPKGNDFVVWKDLQVRWHIDRSSYRGLNVPIFTGINFIECFDPRQQK